MPSLNHYMILSALLFSIGTAGVFLRRNVITLLLSIEIMLNAVNLTFVAIGTAGVFLRRNLITILLSIEIMLNAVNLTFVAFGRALASADGQIIVFFVMTVAAAEAAVGLGIILAFYRNKESVNIDEMNLMRW